MTTLYVLSCIAVKIDEPSTSAAGNYPPVYPPSSEETTEGNDSEVELETAMDLAVYGDGYCSGHRQPSDAHDHPSPSDSPGMTPFHTYRLLTPATVASVMDSATWPPNHTRRKMMLRALHLVGYRVTAMEWSDAVVVGRCREMPKDEERICCGYKWTSSSLDGKAKRGPGVTSTFDGKAKRGPGVTSTFNGKAKRGPGVTSTFDGKAKRGPGVTSTFDGKAKCGPGVTSTFDGKAKRGPGVTSTFNGKAKRGPGVTSTFDGKAKCGPGVTSTFDGKAKCGPGVTSTFNGKANTFNGKAKRGPGVTSTFNGKAKRGPGVTSTFNGKAKRGPGVTSTFDGKAKCGPGVTSTFDGKAKCGPGVTSTFNGKAKCGPGVTSTFDGKAKCGPGVTSTFNGKAKRGPGVTSTFDGKAKCGPGVTSTFNGKARCGPGVTSTFNGKAKCGPGVTSTFDGKAKCGPGVTSTFIGKAKRGSGVAIWEGRVQNGLFRKGRSGWCFFPGNRYNQEPKFDVWGTRLRAKKYLCDLFNEAAAHVSIKGKPLTAKVERWINGQRRAVTHVLTTQGYGAEADSVKTVADWHEASDGRGLSQAQCRAANLQMRNIILILDRWMPWHRQDGDLSKIDMNRRIEGLCGFSREAVIGITTNIESQESSAGPQRHPRVSRTSPSCYDNVFSLLHHKTGGQPCTLKEF
ncbi:KLF18 [Branchiostoma lanceolatum]|uniref:KLF18 protein n=1 Tax=Branchiostoma lanceolatum TaxID=7740 RepID=A0A8J9YRV1_BRALA|nr:KLF18 [Branchiostoma lanceolatum]